MTEQKVGAGDALVYLSGLAADFKTGIVSDHVVRQLIDAILAGMTLAPEERQRVREQALAAWFIE
jgi:hypothetical protein